MKTRKYPILSAGMLLSVLVLAACTGQTAPANEPAPTEAPAEPTEAAEPAEEEAAVSNAVSVEDQSLGEDNTVVIAGVVSDTPGWMVIHADDGGKPGPIVGRAQVGLGDNSDVLVEIDAAAATGTLYAMLHVDAGTEGEFEFPGGVDVPATDAAGQIVTPPFQVELPLTEDQPPAEAFTISLAEDPELGAFLVDAAGHTLYRFDSDEPGVSTCYGQCESNWPIFTVEQGADLTAAGGITGELGFTEREDGTLQLMYDESPLYYFAGDSDPGDTNGHGVGGVWWVVTP